MDDGVNYKLFCKSAGLATASRAGIVTPDGEITTVDSSGKMSTKQATQSTTNIVEGSKSIRVISDGAVVVNTNFTQTEDLANIIAEEAIATILGKMSKAVATTMNLNQSALLKGMLISTDVNGSSKILTAAYIHTLAERIGMGTQLTAGGNLTETANNLSSNLVVANTRMTLNGVKNINRFTVVYSDRTGRASQLRHGPGKITSIAFSNTGIWYDFYDGQNREQVWKFYNPT